MSETEAYEFRAPLSIVIDFKSPNAYLALRPSFELVDSLGIDVEWIPFAAEPIKPYAPVAADAPRGARHRWIRAQYWAKDLERYAERQGLTLKEIHRAPDVLLPGMGLQWLKQNAPDRIRSYLTQCFQGWWSGTLEIESEDAVAALIESTEFVDYCRGQGRLEWEILQGQLLAAGIFEVPSYVVGNELYLGRQHLPMVRKLLQSPGLER